MKRLQIRVLALAALLWVSSAILSPRDTFAVQVNVLETNYTTFISAGFLGEYYERSTKSSIPISDYFYREAVTPNLPGFPRWPAIAEAAAEAGLFEISASGFTGPKGPQHFTHTFASAQTEIIFSPLFDGSKTLEMFFGYFRQRSLLSGFLPQ